MSTVESIYPDHFENGLSSKQSLTFDYMSGVLMERGQKFDDEFVDKFGIAGDEGYSNIGYMLSDQFEGSIKVALFSDESRRIIVDRIDCEGCIIEQFDTAWEFLSKHIAKYHEHKENIVKKSVHFPIEAIREAMVNAVAHRDYFSENCTLVSIFPDKIVITSPGGTDWEYTVDELIIGICSSRNPRLVSVFKFLGLAEVYGSGIPRIFGYYPDSLKPEIHIGKSLFSITLPLVASVPLDRQAFTRSDLEKKGLSRNESINYLNRLLREKKIERIGGGRSTRYVYL